MSNIFPKCSQLCVIAGRLYTLGGVQSKQVDQYDPESDSWKDFFPSLRHCRVAHGVVALDDTIYVAGGSAKVERSMEQCGGPRL